MKIKNLFLGALALTGTLFATSCSQDELIEGVSTGDLVTAQFTITTPDGINTRAIGDGTTVDKVKCVVYNADGSEKMDLDQTLDIVGKTATYNIRLVKGQAYRVAFFAYNEAANAYDVTDMQNILVNDNQPCNIEGRDAFTAMYKITAEETMNPINETITLYRPFAQLNLGAYAEDVEAAKKAGVVVTNSQIVVTNVYTAFNAFADEVTGATSTRTFAMSDIPTEKLLADADSDGTDEEYEYLALNYLLVGNKDADAKSLTDVTFTWSTANGKTNEPVAEFKNVPVQRNYRTNILGWLLTNPAQFNIVIDADFKKPDYFVGIGTPVKPSEDGVYRVEDAEQLLWVGNAISNNAISGAATIKLVDDIDMSGKKWEPINAWNPESATTITFDGDNHTIANLNVQGAGSLGFIGSLATTGMWTIKNLTFEEPTVTSSASFVGTVVGYTYGNLTLENVKVTGANISTTAEKGIRLGGLVGLYPADAVSPLNLTGCVVENSTFNGYHNLAGLVGSAMGSAATFTNCQSNNNTFYHRAENAAAWQNFDANGYAEGKAVKSECTTEGNKGVNQLADGVIKNAAGEYELSNKAGMFWFANQVNKSGNSFAGKTVKMTAQVDLENEPWEPIGQTGKTEFKGVFDGQGNAIYNLYINNTDASAHCATGLFGWVESHGDENVTIKNVTVMSPNVKGHHNVAVIVGYVYGKVEYCTVWDATLECVAANDDANGDKCGAIAGYVGEDASVKGCHVSGSLTISAGRDAGVVAGAAKSACVTSCKINNPEMVSVTANGSSTGANIRAEVIGREL